MKSIAQAAEWLIMTITELVHTSTRIRIRRQRFMLRLVAERFAARSLLKALRTTPEEVCFLKKGKAWHVVFSAKKSSVPAVIVSHTALWAQCDEAERRRY
jgi:hypothetical protein